MIDVLIRIGYIIGVIVRGISIYYWSSTFKKMGDSSIEEINEDEEHEDDMLNDSEAKLLKYFSTSFFILIGFFVWAYIGTTIGKITSDITNHKLLKWICYFFMYFIFLRLPFGVGSRMVKKAFDFESFHEKIIFAITMIAFYILSICCFDIIPNLFKWHLFYLN